MTLREETIDNSVNYVRESQNERDANHKTTEGSLKTKDFQKKRRQKIICRKIWSY